MTSVLRSICWILDPVRRFPARYLHARCAPCVCATARPADPCYARSVRGNLLAILAMTACAGCGKWGFFVQPEPADACGEPTLWKRAWSWTNIGTAGTT